MKPFKIRLEHCPIMGKIVAVPDENGRWIVSEPPKGYSGIKVDPINPNEFISGIDPYEQEEPK